MLLNEGKPDHENQSCYDKSGDDLLHHGCHSMGSDARPKMMNSTGAAVNASPRVSAQNGRWQRRRFWLGSQAVFKVRFGSQADMTTWLINVRFTSDNRHQ